jgi:hypothetical protein
MVRLIVFLALKENIYPYNLQVAEQWFFKLNFIKTITNE